MRVVALFKNPLFLSITGIIALSLAIWFGGGYIAFGAPPQPLEPMTRLVIIMVILVLWGLNNLRIQMKGKIRNDNLIEDIHKETEVRDKGDPATSEEAAALQARFKDALDTIKTLRFGQKDNKRKTVYELPWYLVIGPPGAGKTTILANSGLNFPLKEKFGLKGIGGVGGTRNCDWWFTDQAVLIDTAGRYTTQDSQQQVDQSAWQNFLDLLKKHRPRKAINGVIVAISVSELLMLGRSERSQHADIIRDRIHELRTRLEINFPIYFVITKCDLLAGFNEFFEDLGQVEREQVWGISFPHDKDSNQVNLDYFSGEFDALVKRINERLIWRMHNERDATRLGKIQNFPIQFETLKSMLDQFVHDVFSDNRYQSPPLLRGVYLTSGTQEGTPIDRILSSLSSNYGIDVKSLSASPGQGKAFFIRRLLTELIFMESGIVGLNRAFERKTRLIRRASIITMLLVTVGIVGVWGASLLKNKQLMAQVQEKIAQYHQAVEASEGEENNLEKIAAIIAPLDESRTIYNRLSVPWLSSLGMYDSSVPQAATRAYLSGLQNSFLPALSHRLQNVLNSNPSDDDLYNALRVYLMLGDGNLMEAETVKGWFRDDWLRQLESRAGLQRSLSVYLDDTLGLNETLGNSFLPVRLDPAVVRQAQEKAREVPIERRIYNQIRNHPEFSRKINLANEIGRELKEVFDPGNAGNKLVVRYMFTKEGYDSLDFSKNSPLIRQYASEQWVLGTEVGEDFSDKDIENIGARVKTLYLAEYGDTWKQALAALNVRSFSNMSDARDALKVITSVASSPLNRVIEMAGRETGLTPRIKLLAAEDGEKGLLADAKDTVKSKILPPTIVDNDFADIHRLTDNQELEGIQKKLSSLRELLEGFALAPNQQAAAFGFSKKRFSDSGKDPIRSLLVEARQAPAPISRWLKQIADQSWKVTLNSAKSHLNQLWLNEVYSFYKSSLRGYYPFSANSPNDASLIDFTEFFKPGGVEDSFVTSHLAPFISKGNKWSQRSLNGRSMGISKNALEQMKRADTIRKVFFRKNASRPGISFTIKPRQMDSSVRRFEMRIGDTRVRYTHGPKLPRSLSWPFASGDTIQLVFEGFNESLREKSYTGDWSLFRALDDAGVLTTKRANLFFVTFQVKKRKIQYELKADSFLNPFRSSWMRRYTSPQTL
ncbi:MAG: type VI secretion system membrane subunit TssM [Gammaproteobacteria bacterium]|nr:MAG: type VI secretion system membrane subunit TssM [Pseudomonadota bacterium]PIE38173.1 MAG: type VI secretion system membrane subunit TssM [Gammaproteobacteria bacterium]